MGGSKKVLVILMLHVVTKEDYNSFNSDKHTKITGMNGRFISCRRVSLWYMLLEQIKISKVDSICFPLCEV